MNISNNDFDPLSIHTNNDALRQLVIIASHNITVRRLLLGLIEECETAEDYEKALMAAAKNIEPVIVSALSVAGIPVSFDENPKKPSSEN